MPDEKAGFELRDHTADIALYAWGDSMPALFAAAADGLYATIGELQLQEECRNEALHIQAGDPESLLRDFLAELHFRFETRHTRYSHFTFTRLDDTTLDAAADVATIDPKASILDREIKAVTHHDLNIVQHDGRYEVTVILDI